jgi:hypothetical protein
MKIELDVFGGTPFAPLVLVVIYAIVTFVKMDGTSTFAI